ncbi:hypothetical protein [Massilia sp. YIM B04103]|uniref:hypothetical protein n=1 Tax=Massilia sp. YIM B04103 TaxID=2963106 RepID=UPI00210F1CB0|nr:hypothetical protein [Massilia sp. YIM B04103]
MLKTKPLIRFLSIAIFASFNLAGKPAFSQAPTLGDLVDNNLAFLKLDKKNAALGANFNMHFIEPLWVNGQLYTYYIKWVDGHAGIALATSSDGINFSDQGMVLTIGSTGSFDNTYASFPGVWYENGTFYLVYEGAGEGARGTAGDIGLATSTDGRNFTKQGIILRHDQFGWERVNIGTPSLYKENGTWYLHYHGYDGNTCQIGVATGTDLFKLVKYSANPIIKSVPNTWQAGTAGRRGITKSNNRYYMVFEGSEAKKPNAPGFGEVKWSSGLASSGNLLDWTTFSQNSVLPQTVLGGSNSAHGFGNDGPTFLKLGSEQYIYYRAATKENNAFTRRAMIATPYYGGFDISWNVNSPNIGHNIGRPDGDGWSANMSQDTPQFLQYGPYYTNTPVGDNIITWSFMIDNNSSDNADMLRLEVVDVDDNFSVIAQRNITRKQFKQTGRYEYFSVPFRLDPSKRGHRLEFRSWWYGRAFIRQGVVGIS